MKTIKRKPGWPKWAKWKFAHMCGESFIASHRPYTLKVVPFWALSRESKFIATKGRKPYRTDAWQRSLRRIVP